MRAGRVRASKQVHSEYVGADLDRFASISSDGQAAPGFYPRKASTRGHQFLPRAGNGRAAYSRMPPPANERILAHVARRFHPATFAAVPLRGFNLLADLTERLASPGHLSGARRQSGCPGEPRPGSATTGVGIKVAMNRRVAASRDLKLVIIGNASWLQSFNTRRSQGTFAGGEWLSSFRRCFESAYGG